MNSSHQQTYHPFPTVQMVFYDQNSVLNQLLSNKCNTTYVPTNTCHKYDSTPKNSNQWQNSLWYSVKLSENSINIYTYTRLSSFKVIYITEYKFSQIPFRMQNL